MLRPDESDSSGQFNRRRFVQAVGAAGIAGIAGCAGDGGGGEGGDGGDGGDGGGNGSNGGDGEDLQHVDRYFLTDTWSKPDEMDWNVYKTGGVGGEWELVTHPLVEFNDKSGEFVSTVLEDWSIDGTTATLKMREDHVWHDGEDVTAEDVVTKMKIDMFIGSPLNDFVAEPSADGDYTVKLELKEEISEEVLLWTLYNLPLDTPTSVYGKFRDMIEAGDKSEKEIQTQLSSEFSLEEPVGFGPTQFTSTTASELTLDKWDEHPFADKFNFSGYKYKYLPSNQQTWQAAKGNEVDGFDHFMPMEVVDGLPEAFVHKLYPAYVGLGIAMNHEHPVFGKKKVRQAMAHAVRRTDVAEAAGGDLKVGAEYITGTAVSNREEYFSDVIDQFNRYNKPEEEGKQLMRDAGYSMEGGNWVKQDGSPIEANVHADAAASDWVSAARSVSSQLSQFGFNSSIVSEESSAFWEKWAGGEMPLSIGHWGSWFKRYPYFDYYADLTKSWKAEQRTNWNPVVTTPTLNGEEKEVDLEEKVGKLAAATGDDAKTLIQELGYIYNENLPIFQIMEKKSQAIISGDGWEFPPKDDKEMAVKFCQQYLPRSGQLHATQN